MTREEIKYALEFNETDISDARRALAEAQKDLAEAKAKRAELLAALAKTSKKLQTK